MIGIEREKVWSSSWMLDNAIKPPNEFLFLLWIQMFR